MASYSKRRLFAAASPVTLIILLGCFTPARAQVSEVQEAAAEAEFQGEVITVTGTRIARPGAESNSPLTVVSDEEITFQGAVNIENVLNRLPQVVPGANENVSNGSDGTATVNLRDLGSARNLVLINGQRMLPIQAQNLNFVPTFMVERVDVVTGGASAVYGSDAMSGVVNFILKDDLDGFMFDVQGSVAQHHNDNRLVRGIIDSFGYENAPENVWDGEKYAINVAFGADLADGRGNVTAYAGYRKANPILQADRDVSACALNQAENNTTFGCGGSSNNAFGRFTPLAGPSVGLNLANAKDGSKNWVPYDNSYLYNYAPLNYFQRPDERWTFGAFAHYELTPQVELYGSAMFMDDHSFSQVAPSALWFGENYAINCNNPLMSEQQGQLLCGEDYGTSETIPVLVGYRPVAEPAQGRIGDLHHFAYRLTGGVRGEIIDGLTYDVSALRSYTTLEESYLNDIYPPFARNAIQVVDVDGTPTCLSVVNGTDPNCVPLDIFGYGTLSAEGLGYVYVPTSSTNPNEETILSAVISSDFTRYGIVSPWASDGVALVLGTEYRTEALERRPDASRQATGQTVTEGEFEVLEFFGELELPIIQDRPWARSLTVNAGYRISDYDFLDETIETYKVEFDYAPSADIRFRASYNHAIRAPNVSELNGNQQLGNVSGAQDPCSGTNPEASLEACALTGVTPAQYGNIPECPADVCVTLSGGNPNLRPEEADTYTVGAVLTPTVLPGLMLAADYYDITIDGYISSVPASVVISQCISTGNPFFCDLFNRAPTTGILFGTEGYIESALQNTGSLATSGVDVTADYSFEAAGAGRFSLGLVGTYLLSWENETLPGLGSYDCVGLFGPSCGQPAPEWRHNARLTWEEPFWDRLTLSLAWRYIGSTKLTLNQDDPFLAGAKHEINAELPAYSYFDLVASAEVAENVNFRVGVNNLFDRSPPAIAEGLLAEFGNGNTYPGVYDIGGRVLFVGLSGSF